jgi:hypothetical protein
VESYQRTQWYYDKGPAGVLRTVGA